MSTRTDRAHRLERAMSSLARRGTLVRLHQAIAEAAGVDVDRAAYLVLRRLRLEGPARIGDLAAGLGVDPSTVSRHVAMLEGKGWLEKLPLTHDRRVTVARVTPAGSALVDEMEGERHGLLDQALAAWQEADVDRFVELMERFTDDLADTLERREEHR